MSFDMFTLSKLENLCKLLVVKCLRGHAHMTPTMRGGIVGRAKMGCYRTLELGISKYVFWTSNLHFRSLKKIGFAP